MARRFGWRSTVALVVAACASEQVTAPGACPAFCTGTGIQAADTVLVTAVRGDSSFHGYLSAHSAGELQIASDGGAAESRGVIRFFRFAARLGISSADTTTAEIAQIDSIRVDLNVRRRSQDASNLRLVLYRIAPTVDSLTTFDDLTPYFADSMLIREVAVAPDSLGNVKAVFPGDALPTFKADSFEAAIGLAVRADLPAFVSLGSTEIGRGAQMFRYVQIDSAGTRVKRTDARIASFDSFLFRPRPPVAAGTLAVGGAPSARTFVRLSIPARIVDSSRVVRATLLLVPAAPVAGAPGDTVRIVAHGVSADVGPKSPVVPTASDSASYAGGRAAPGSTDTVRIDVTDIVRSWRSDTVRARTLVLRVLPEAGSLGEVRFWSSADAARRPALDVTYIPPVTYLAR